MKFKTTAKAIRHDGGKIVCIDYCGAQYLLRYHDPIAYTSGVYGWNFDVYYIDGVTICTGYRGMPGKAPEWKVLEEYEKKAEKIACNWNIPYDEQKQQVNALLSEWLKTV